MRYTAEQVRQLVEAELDQLLLPWMTGRGPNYTIDPATQRIIATGYWLDRELAKICNDADRRTQCWKFNRMCCTYEIWETAAECMNDVFDGVVEQDRVGHRRWG